MLPFGFVFEPVAEAPSMSAGRIDVERRRLYAVFDKSFVVLDSIAHRHDIIVARVQYYGRWRGMRYLHFVTVLMLVAGSGVSKRKYQV